METVTVEIDAGLIGVLLQEYQKRRNAAVHRREVVESEISTIDNQIARLEATRCRNLVVACETAHIKVSAGNVRLTSTGRVERGQSEKLIEQWLTGRNGTGSTIHEIMQATGTKYGTINRLLKLWKRQGRVLGQGNHRNVKWRWNAEIYSREKKAAPLQDAANAQRAVSPEPSTDL